MTLINCGIDTMCGFPREISKLDEIYEETVLSQLEEQFESNIEDAVSRNQPLWKKLKLYDELSQRREQEITF